VQLTFSGLASVWVEQGRREWHGRVVEIKHLLEAYPRSSRSELSRRLAAFWDWRTASGQLKDMAARPLLLKLHEQGWIQYLGYRSRVGQNLQC
jgi:hypothetical protein